MKGSARAKKEKGNSRAIVKHESAELRTLRKYVEMEQEKRKIIQGYIRDNLVKGTDWGTIMIHGKESKPILFKPGSEKICSLLHLDTTFEKDEQVAEATKGADNWLIIPLKCKLINETGKVMAEGRGVASAYKASGNFDFELNKQVKIAEKRAQVDAVLRLGFSDYFTQDLEDMDKKNPVQEKSVVPKAEKIKMTLPEITATTICSIGKFQKIPTLWHKLPLQDLLYFQEQSANPERLDPLIRDKMSYLLANYSKLINGNGEFVARVMYDKYKKRNEEDLTTGEFLNLLRKLKRIWQEQKKTGGK
jgi:hypothetical protein